jgi:membrane protease YdiL (CAAX protease family)
VIKSKQVKQKLNKFAKFSPFAEPLTFKKALLLYCYVEGILFVAEWLLFKINLYNDILVYIFFLAAVLIAAREMGKDELRRILAWRNVPLAVFASVMVMYYGFEIVASELRNLFLMILPIPEGFFSDWYWEDIFHEILAHSLFPGFSEEILFRGIIAYGFYKVYPLRKAILLSALLFGIYHMNPWQAVSAFYGGILFGWLYWRYKSIWLCMFLHAYHNALVYMPFDLPYVQNEYYEFTRHPVWFDLLGLLLFGLGLLSVIVLSRKGNADEENAEIIKTLNINKAIAEYTHVIKLVPDNAFTYMKRGLAYSDIKNYDKAIADYTQAIKLDLNYALAYNNRGRAHYRKGNYDKAIADYEEALKINPNDADAKQGLEKAMQARR